VEGNAQTTSLTLLKVFSVSPTSNKGAFILRGVCSVGTCLGAVREHLSGVGAFVGGYWSHTVYNIGYQSATTVLLSSRPCGSIPVLAVYAQKFSIMSQRHVYCRITGV